MPAPHNYRQFVGLAYKPPYGCLHLVQQVFAMYGVDLSALTDELPGNPPGVRAIHECLMRHTVPVDTPAEGDVAFIRAEPWHVGVVVEPGWMLHSYSGEGYGSAVCQRYDGPEWGNSVRGFYRYKGFV